MIYTVVCTDLNESVDWQCRLLEYTWKRAGQPGTLLRLVSCPEGADLPRHPHAEVRRVEPATHRTMGYRAFERLFALEQWLRADRPHGTVLVLDPDCVFLHPICDLVAPGTPRGQHWVDMTPASDAVQPVTWPMLIDAADLEALLPSWISFTAALYQTTHRWESDMYALVSAAAAMELRFSLAAVGAFVGWPDEQVGGAPIVHYCQEVLDSQGRLLWSKRSYRPWDAVANPNRAKHHYCRDLLALVNEYAALRQ